MLYFSLTKTPLRPESDDSSFMNSPLCARSYDPAQFRPRPASTERWASAVEKDGRARPPGVRTLGGFSCGVK